MENDLKGNMDNFIEFYSSNKELNVFLNDFLIRNIRIDEKKIGWSPEENPDFWVLLYKEWDAMYSTWFDCTLNTLKVDRHKAIKEYLLEVPVDKFGYVWSAKKIEQPSLGNPKTYFNQGWPFPDYTQSHSNSAGWEFNNDSPEGWTSSTTTVVKDGYFSTALKGKIVEILSPTINVDSFHAPFVEIDFRVNGVSQSNPLDGLKIYWQTVKEPYFSDDKSVDSRYHCTLPKKTVTDSSSNYLFFPMYLFNKWSKQRILRLKIVVNNSRDMINMNIDINFIRLNYDTRQTNNNAILINASAIYYFWTGDREFLRLIMPKLRMSLAFLNIHMKGKKKGLIDYGYMLGHDGIRGIGHGIGNGYWDILSLGQMDICSTTYYYRAIMYMDMLERELDELDMQVEKPSICSPDGKSTINYYETAHSICQTAKKVRKTFRKTFWDKNKGRFIGGIDSRGKTIDYGFVILNLEAIASGLADKNQEKMVMQWIDGSRVIEGDLSTREDIYYFKFAPRTTTIKNNSQYLWEWDGSKLAFGQQVQDGGTVMYSSFYDLVCRIKVLGVKNAYSRLKEISTWYTEVSKRKGEGREFYSEYYKNSVESLQGHEGPGGIGLKDEFLESALMYSAIPLGFFGLKPGLRNTLTIEPQIPLELRYMGMKNVMYHGILFDIECGEKYVEITNLRHYENNARFRIKVPYSSKGNVFVENHIPDKITKDGFWEFII